MWELQVKLYTGKNEDGSPEDSTSDSSENLQRGREERLYKRFWWREGTCNQTQIFPEGFFWSHKTSANHKKESSPWRVLVFS